MDLGVIEVVVNTGHNTLLAVLRIVLGVLAVCFLLFGIAVMWPALILAVACGVGAYMADLNSIVDYEYSLVDNELRVARILKKEKRKYIGTYDLAKLEIMAPENAYQIDSYRRLDKYKTLDFSDRGDTADRYHVYIDGKERLLLTINSEEGARLVRCIRQYAPGKVILGS